MSHRGINQSDPIHLQRWRPALAHFLPPEDSVHQIRTAGGGLSGAIVLRVEADSGIYALRGWSVGSIQVERIVELHWFVNHLSKHGVPVAVPRIALSKPSTLIESGGQLWQLEPWLPGQASASQDGNVAAINSAMQTIAKMHLAAEGYRSTRKGSEWFAVRVGSVPAVTERIQIMDRWDRHEVESYVRLLNSAKERFRQLGQAILGHYEQFRELIRSELLTLQGTLHQLFPCWRDLRREHLLFTDDVVTGIIDPAATRTDHPGTDLSRLLGSLYGDDRSKWEFALRDYSQVRPLTEIDRQLVRALDRSSVLLSGLTWLERWQAGAISSDLMDDVIARMEIIEGRMRQLALPRFESE